MVKINPNKKVRECTAYASGKLSCLNFPWLGNRFDPATHELMFWTGFDSIKNDGKSWTFDDHYAFVITQKSLLGEAKGEMEFRMVDRTDFTAEFKKAIPRLDLLPPICKKTMEIELIYESISPATEK